MNVEKFIQSELSKMDHRLILDKAWSPFGYVFYTVKYIHEDSEPYIVLDWREGNQPLHLATDLLVKLRSQEGDITEAIREVTVNNVVKKELDRQKAKEELDNVISEHQFENSGFKVGDATPRKRRSRLD